MFAWAQRMVLIKKDMVHNDDDDVDRIYRGTSERQVQVADASSRFRDPPYAMRLAPRLFPFAPYLVSVDPCGSK